MTLLLIKLLLKFLVVKL